MSVCGRTGWRTDGCPLESNLRLGEQAASVRADLLTGLEGADGEQTVASSWNPGRTDLDSVMHSGVLPAHGEVQW